MSPSHASSSDGSRRPTLRRHLAGAAALTLAAATLAACGGEAAAGPPTLTWYINNPAQAPLAKRCAEQADGAYDITTSLLPTAASGQREQLLRRLAANDRSIDIMSLDPPFMAEFANAGFLRPFTEQERKEFADGVLEGPLEQSLFAGRMYSAPFYGNTQLLWYKKSVAEAAGLDPDVEPVTWDQLVEAAEQTSTTIGAQGRRNESLMVWVNALVEGAGGSILDPDSQGQPPERVEAAIDSPAGAAAAAIMNSVAEKAAYPGFSTGGEEESRAAFQAEDGGFMVNWPYVWTAFDSAIEAGALPPDFKETIGWARYPRTVADRESAPPLGGIGLSVSAFSQHPDLAVEAVRCLRSLESQKAYMLDAGDPGVASALYDDPEIRQAFPMAEEIREGMNDAAPRPITPYYGDVTSAVQRGYHPPDELSPETTPDRTASLIEGVLDNEQLL